MGTLTALQPRPYIMPRAEARVQLVPAYPDDLKMYCPVLKRQVLRLHMIYWIKSSITGIIEDTPYIITEHTKASDIKEWLDCNMIYIARTPFN